MPKRTYQPKKKHRIRVHGFRHAWKPVTDAVYLNAAVYVDAPIGCETPTCQEN